MKLSWEKIWIIAGLVAVQSHANDIVVSWSSNGVLHATCIMPGSTCTVEWASSLKDQFTNSPTIYQGIISDTNGTINLKVPMFFRVKGIPDTRWMTNGLVAYYPFDEGAQDYSINQNHGTVDGAILTNGIIGQAYAFDGTNDSIEVPHHSSLNLTNQISVSFWFKGSDDSYRQIFLKKSGGTGLLSWFADLAKGGIGDGIDFYVSQDGYAGSGNRVYRRQVGESYQDGEWHHYLGVFDGNTAYLYIDSIAVGELVTNSVISGIAPNDLPIEIGINYDGIIDEVRIYDRSLSEDEIKYLYQAKQ